MVSARPARGDELPDVTPSRLGIAPRFASAPGLDAATIPNVGTPARGDQPPLVTSVAIKAPWLGGLGFLAGGLDELVFLLGEVLLSPAIGFVESEIIFQLWRNSRDASNSECGWSPASGAYYNQLGHAYDPPNSYDQFAIDFSRWSGNGIAAENLSKGTPILACGNGVVLGLEDRYPSGSDRQNIVELGLAETFAEAQLHRTYNPRTDPPYARGIYRASHVHLEGPLLSPVSRLQWVEQGFVLGFMDDSGNSFHDHLHFHIQDRRLLAEGSGSGAGNGRTVRPYWMEGETLFDDEGGSASYRRTRLPTARLSASGSPSSSTFRPSPTAQRPSRRGPLGADSSWPSVTRCRAIVVPSSRRHPAPRRTSRRLPEICPRRPSGAHPWSMRPTPRAASVAPARGGGPSCATPSSPIGGGRSTRGPRPSSKPASHPRRGPTSSRRIALRGARRCRLLVGDRLAGCTRSCWRLRSGSARRVRRCAAHTASRGLWDRGPWTEM